MFEARLKNRFITCLGLFFLPLWTFASDTHLIKYATPDVRLYTDVGKDVAQEVIDEIQFYGETLDGFFASYGITQKKSNPIRCYLYQNLEDFIVHCSREHTVGRAQYAYFSPGNNRIVASFSSPDPDARAARAALRRECGRQIVHRYFTNPPPAWFDEGFARYFEGLAFDPHGNLISPCSDLSRFDSIKYFKFWQDEETWKRFFDERPLDYNDTRSGANVPGGMFSTLAWGVIFFYLHSKADEDRELFDRFVQGMNTGRERSKLLRLDLQDREYDFRIFFSQDHQEVFKLYTKARNLWEKKRYRQALPPLMDILQRDEKNISALRLAAEVTWDDERYEPSLSFWKQLAAIDPRCALYKWKICRALAESGRLRKNEDTLREAVQAGEDAVQATHSQDPDCLAALAMALHASNRLQEALRTMRKATFLGGPSYETYKELEKQYSMELITQPIND
jgi:tetratricopeptide (TPR) repeat protein